MKMTSNKTAVGYARVSTTSESQETSIPNQKERIKFYCDSRNWKLMKVFEDEGVSGKNTEREGFSRLKDYLNSHEMDSIIVTNLDRFSRDPRDVISEIDWLNNRNIDFVSIDQSIDTSTTTGEMVMVLISYLNRMEREKTVEKINHSLKRKKERGEPLGRPPFGLKYSEDKTCFVPNRDFQTALRALKLRKKGFSIPSIEEELSIPSSTISRLLKRKEMYKSIASNSSLPLD